MITVAVAAEGASDIAAIEKILASREILVDPKRRFVKRGKSNLDPKLRGFNRAAQRSPWFVLRDSDHDEGDCPAALREVLRPAGTTSRAMCFRLAVRSLEAWLLGDAESFASFFGTALANVPIRPEDLPNPKAEFVNACWRSRRSTIRKAMVPPSGSSGTVGPEYVTYISRYAKEAWRPDVAARNAPSLARALNEIDRLVSTGVWQ
ncbi:MAG: hypothetical protein ACRCYQ_05345 [Nocardioides sp.]